MYACSSGRSGCCWVISGRVDAIGECAGAGRGPTSGGDPLDDDRTNRQADRWLVASSVTSAMGVPPETELHTAPRTPTDDIPFLDAARGRQASRRAVWFMRQAGRSLPEYRAVRGEGSILDAIKRPELAA